MLPVLSNNGLPGGGRVLSCYLVGLFEDTCVPFTWKESPLCHRICSWPAGFVVKGHRRMQWEYGERLFYACISVHFSKWLRSIYGNLVRSQYFFPLLPNACAHTPIRISSSDECLLWPSCLLFRWKSSRGSVRTSTGTSGATYSGGVGSW